MRTEATPTCTYMTAKEDYFASCIKSSLHFDTPFMHVGEQRNGAGYRNRTRDLLITNQLLYQLS